MKNGNLALVLAGLLLISTAACEQEVAQEGSQSPTEQQMGENPTTTSDEGTAQTQQ